MKILFFLDAEYPGFRGSEAEKLLQKCGVEYLIFGRGVDLVVAKIKNTVQEECVMRVLSMAGISYVYEMEGVPRVLRVRSMVTGRVKAEVEFR
jgi:hypothetical protein